MRTRYQQMTAGGIDGYSNFMGDDTDYRDWLGVGGRHRDSSLREISNFEQTLKALGGRGPNVRVENYGHWGVGWIEEIYVRPGTPEEEKAREIEAALANYPVLDDTDYFNRVHEAICKYWQEANLRERVRLCDESGASIFAARREDYPEEVHDQIRAYVNE